MSLSTIRIAWRNLGRNRTRTWLALTVIAFGQFALIVAQAVYRGNGDAVLEVTTGPLIGDVQLQAEGWRTERAMDLTVGRLTHVVAGLRAHREVAAACPRVFGPALAAAGAETTMAIAVGVDVEAESAHRGLLEFVDPSERPGGGRVLVGRTLAHLLGIGPGDELAIIGQTADGFIANDLFTASGIITSPVEFVNTTGIVLALDEAQELFEMPDQAHQIVVRGAPGVDARALAGSIARTPAVAGLEVIPWQEAVPILATVINVMNVAGYFIIAVLFIAAIAGITNTLMMSTFERVHEFGMLLALGSRPRRIVGMIFAEAVVLGLLGAAAGTALGLLAVRAMSRTGIDMMGIGEATDVSFSGMHFPSLVFPRNTPTDVVAGLVAVMLTSLLAGIWPARCAARLEPMEAMRT